MGRFGVRFASPQEYANAESTVSLCRPCVIVLYSSVPTLPFFFPLTVFGGGLAFRAF